MDGLTPILNLYSPEFKSAAQAPLKTMPAQPDKLELSNKKQEKGSYINVLEALVLTAAAASGGIYGGKKIYQKYFQKLACGVKKGEINDALYNFIKNNDPKGTLFNNKAAVIELNNGLTDEKLIILKQLAKMKDSDVFVHRGGESGHRFSLGDIKSLLEEANEGNIKYLEQLAKKSEKLSGDRVKTFSPNQILKVLQCINSNNEKVAKQLIDITGIRSEEIEKLTECLKSINKDNIDIWQVLLTTRKKGEKTELNLESLLKLAQKVEETQNPKCAEALLNAEKKNGTGTYVHNIDDILAVLPELKENNAEIYQRFYEIKAVAEIQSSKCASLTPAVNEHNIELVEEILTKAESDSNLVIFSNYSTIKKILEEINGENKEIAQKLLKLMKSKYVFTVRNYNAEDNFLDILKKIKNPEQRSKAERILEGGNISDFASFVNRFSKPDSSL